MRILVLFTMLVFFGATSAFSMKATSFDEFIKSREVVTTVYFQANAEGLSSKEQKKLSETIQTLRKLQNNGRMIRVEGFSSPEGNQEGNFQLSFFRARSVAEQIKAGGLPAEVSLTGYGDLRAKRDDPSKERRVEIASYLKPVGLKRVKVAKKKRMLRTTSAAQTINDPAPQQLEVDSYRVDQAIRRKIDDKNRGIAEQLEELEKELAPGISQSNPLESVDDIERGYSLWRKSVDPDYSPKVTHVRSPAKDFSRGYSQSQKSADSENAPKLGRVKQVDPAAPKLGRVKQVDPTAPKLGRVKQVDPTAPKLGRVKQVDSELQRSLSKWVESIEARKSPGVTILSPDWPSAIRKDAPDLTMVLPDEMAPTIDALMIEQAIMEKLGVEPAVPSGSVTQVVQPSRNQSKQ